MSDNKGKIKQIADFILTQAKALKLTCINCTSHTPNIKALEIILLTPSASLLSECLFKVRENM